MPLTARNRLPALGAIFVTLAVFTASLRMDESWAAGVHLLLAAVPALALLGLALRERGSTPRADAPTVLASTLAMTGLALFALADYRFLDLIGVPEDADAAGTAFFVILAVAGALVARRAGSAAAVLFTALVAGGAVIAAAQWAGVEDVDAFQGILAGLAVVYALVGHVAFVGHPRYRDVLMDAAGVALVGIAFFLGNDIFAAALGGMEEPPIPLAWQVVLLVGGLALAVYTAHHRAPGPGTFSVVVLGFFVLSVVLDLGMVENPLADGRDEDDVVSDETLGGWPIALAGLAIVSLAGAALTRGRSGDRGASGAA